MIRVDSPILRKDVCVVNEIETSVWLSDAVDDATLFNPEINDPLFMARSAPLLPLMGLGFSRFIENESKNDGFLNSVGISELADEWFYRDSPRLVNPSGAHNRYQAFTPVDVDVLGLGMIGFRGYVNPPYTLYSNVIQVNGRAVALPTDASTNVAPLTMPEVHSRYGALYFAQEPGGNVMVGGFDKLLRTAATLAPAVRRGFVRLKFPGNGGSQWLTSVVRLKGDPIVWTPPPPRKA